MRVVLAVLVLVGVGVPVALASGTTVSTGQPTYVPSPLLTERPESQRPRPDVASIASQVTAARQREAERRQWRATSEQRDVRRRSRQAFAGLGPVNALRAARQQQSGVVSVPLWQPLQLRAGERIKGYVNAHTAQIDSPGESSDGLAYSLDPMMTRDAKGDAHPVDLTLTHGPSGFVPRNAPVDVQLPDGIGDGVRVASLGITVRPGSSGDASLGSEVAGKVFYANVATDTDFMVAPVPKGVEVFHVLRSEASPERLPLDFDLPSGTRLRPAGPTTQAQQQAVAFEVVRDRDDVVVATVSKPTALDADGEPVDVKADLVGTDEIVLVVAHRGADVKYPIIVDPVVGDAIQDDYDWRSGSPAFAGWSFGSAPYNYFLGSAGNGTAGNGLYIYAFPNGAYSSGQYAQWAAFAPGTAYIYRAEFGYVNHVPGNSQIYEGIYSITQGRWEISYTTAGSLSNNWRTLCVTDCGWAGTPDNAMVIGMLMTGPTSSYGTFGAAVYMGHAIMMIHDDDSPTVGVSHQGLPSGWTKEANVHTTVHSVDPGVGVRGVGFGDDLGDYSTTLDTIFCGDHYFRCPNTTSNTFDYGASGRDGVHTFAALARDAINHTTTSAPWVLKIDTTAPDVTVGGTLKSMEGKELSEDSYMLKIDAIDQHPTDQSVARSGIRNIQVLLDDAPTPYQDQAEQACPGAGCTMHRDWEFRPFDQDLTVGNHTLKLVVTDYAGNVTSETPWTIKIPRGKMITPRSGDLSEKRFNLQAQAKRPGFSTATFVYRRTSSDPWTVIPAADLRTTSGGSVSGTAQPLSSNKTAVLVWDAGTTLGADTPVQIRAHFDGNELTPSNTAFASYKPNGLGADYARQDLGPGSVDLLTGNFIVTEDDATIASYATDLTIRRTYASRLPRPAVGQPAGPFGPGWLASAPVEAAGADYVKLIDTGSSASVTLDDTATVQFAANATGYDPQAGYEDLKLTKTNATTFTLTDTAGDSTVFTQIQGNDYRPTAASPPGSETTTNYEYEVVGGDVRMARVLAPRPQGVSSCAPMVAGCRELRFSYTPSGGTTASGTAPASWGSYAGRLDKVMFGYGADGGGSYSEQVSQYQYDSNGRLRAAWDPRLVPALKTTYDYDSTGLLISDRPPGEEPWTMTYQTIPTDSSPDRLRTLSRSGPSGTATWTAVYDVPLSGTGAPYPMSESNVSAWAQTDTPIDATAIFPPDQVPTGTPTSYTRATVHYLNGSGREVNTATPGANITTSEYDEHHNVVRSLTAANRARALSSTDPAARARTIDTIKSYDTTGLELREQWEPQHEVMLPSLHTVQARRHTVTTYDADGVHLPKTVRVGAAVIGQASDADVRTTVYDYDAVGKSLRMPTTTTIDPDGLNLAARTAYDAGTGLEVSRTLPEGNANGTDAGTTKTIYYTAGANAADSACANRPVWANLVCKIKPAAQPTSSLPAIPTKTFEYNRLSQPTTIVESVDSTARATVKEYDVTGRPIRETMAATTGTNVPAVTHGYSPTTGRETTLSTSSPAQTMTTVYDSIGRETQYTDSDGVTTLTSYDLLDRPSTIDDGKAQQTRSYDPVRGLLSTINDPQIGALGTTRDADGTIATKTYPNGLIAVITTNEAGEPTTMRYVKSSNCGASCEWLLSQATRNIHGQQIWQSTTTQTGQLSADNYTYDAAGRLALNGDIVGASSACTVSSYEYDRNSNRKRLEIRPPGTGGACQLTGSSTITTSAYDEADRTTNAGFDYDNLGRILTVPAAQAGGGQLTSTYYTNDLTRSLTQDGITRTYSLDPAHRVRARNTTGTTTSTETYHYASVDDNGLDSPTWIAENPSGTQYTRRVAGVDGDLVALRDASGSRLQLANLHDDVVAEASPDPAASTLLNGSADNSPFGLPHQETGRRLAWLGAKQRPTELSSGIVAMGVRTYAPSLGRFLQPDPVDGGSDNDYDYAHEDPVNKVDLDGRVGPCSSIQGKYTYPAAAKKAGCPPRPPGAKTQQVTALGRFVVCDVGSAFVGGGAVKALRALFSGSTRVLRVLSGLTSTRAATGFLSGFAANEVCKNSSHKKWIR